MTHADQFSQFAEAHNVLDHAQLQWAIRPYPVALTLSGYVKAEGIFDTRQNFEFRDGQILYYPLKKMPDVLGKDINARGDFDAFAIQSRFDLEGIGPDIGCMKSRIFIEGEFLGRTDITINECDLRLAFLELTSPHFNFLAGQYFHPLGFPYEFPDTISFNYGTPMLPFALCPQFKFTYHDEHAEIFAVGSGFFGDRPFGPAGGTDKVFRDAMMPDFYVQARYLADEFNYIGIGMDVHRLVPRLVTDLGYKEVSPVTAVTTQAFMRTQYENFVTHSKVIYAQDGGIFELLGGIAVHTHDPLTDFRTYVPLRTAAWSVEFIWEGPIEPALFFGVVKNLGAGTTIVRNAQDEVEVFGLGTDINTVFRIAPRIRWYLNTFIIGVEYEYTRAAYGIIDNRGNVQNTIPVANNRVLFATYYVF